MISTLDKTALLGPGSASRDPRWAIPDARSLLAGARRWAAPIGSATPAVPPLTLELPERTIRLRGPRVLGFVLAGRTQFPIARLREALHWSPQRLERASAAIRVMERRLSEILTLSLQAPERMDELLTGIELKAFSKDHEWRDIMENVLRLAPEFEPYKRVALIKYLQYLRSRQSALKGIFRERSAGMPHAALHATPIESTSAIGAELAASATCELDAIADHDDRDGLLAILPKGETVCVRLEGRRSIPLALAGNAFRLEAGRRFTLIDDDGNRLPLKVGKNVIGRHPACDVRVDPACRAISRRHLVVEPVSEDTVLVTDVSAHGTQIPASLV